MPPCEGDDCADMDMPPMPPCEGDDCADMDMPPMPPCEGDDCPDMDMPPMPPCEGDDCHDDVMDALDVEGGMRDVVQRSPRRGGPEACEGEFCPDNDGPGPNDAD